MEELPTNTLLEYPPDLIKNVRNLYDLDDPKRLEEAIDILQEWTRQQNHFIVKEFDRECLERFIITNKGLLERSKTKLDKICTLRTLVPELFSPVNVKTDLSNIDFFVDAILPKMTSDNCRVYIVQNNGKQFTYKSCMDYYVRQINYWHYLHRYDYSAGFIAVYDLSEANVVEIIKSINLTDFRNFATTITEGFGSRVRGVYVISKSKLVITLADLVKSVNKKIVNRIVFLEDRELLKTKLSPDILPVDYGGKEKSMAELHQNWIDEISSDDHIDYMKKMFQAKTDESKRQVGKFNEEYLGMPGTFRTLSVD